MATTKKNELAKVDAGIIEALDSAIERGIAAQAIAGRMSRTLAVAGALQDIRVALDAPGVMDSVMALQGTSLGFRTDKDKDGGYPMPVVRDCFIEANLQGVSAIGNEFNIIVARFYLTKEGIRRKLSQLEGLRYSLTPGIPKTMGAGAIQPIKIKWDFQGEKGEELLEIPVRVNAGMGSDAIIGKATGKAGKWLYAHIKGYELPCADIGEDEPINITPAKRSPFEKSPKPEITPDAPADLKADPLAEWGRVIDASPLTLQDWEHFASHHRGETMTPENAALWLEDAPRYINACLDFLDEQKPAAGTDGELL